MIKIYARGSRRAEVLIHEAIGEDWFGNGLTSKRFVQELNDLGEVDEILVRINSPGGAVFDGVAIYNALKEHRARIDVLVEGLAASIASVIAMAGDRIRMGEGALMMIHNPWTLAIGDADDLRKTAETLDQVTEALIDIYQARTGLSRDEIRTMLDAETWFTAAQAVEKGFADEAATEDESDEAVAAVRHDHRARYAQAREQFRRKADQNAMRIAASLLQSVRTDATQESTMPETNTTPASGQTTDVNAAVQEALAAERNRRAGIRQAFGRFAAEYRELLDACLEDERCTVDAARERLLAKLGERHEPLSGTFVQPGADARDKFLAGAEQALLARIGLAKREEGNEFAGRGLPDLAATALTRAGVSVKGLTRAQVAAKIFAMQTTSDFPQLMSNVAGKVLRAAYSEFPPTWRAWAAKGEVSDFKIHPRIQLGAFNSLEEIPEGGEYTYGSFKEDYENAQAVTKGKAIALTRQMIVNDDLGAFQRRARFMGRAAARTVNEDAYKLLTSGTSNNGPTSSDGVQYFNASHSNLTSPGTVINLQNIGKMRAAMRKQKDKSGRQTLNIEPKVLLVPVGLEDTAKQLITSESDPAATNSRVRNIYYNALTVVSDPYLDGVSATAYYLFADPNDVPAFEVVFLDGIEEPFVDEMIDFDTDAMKFKVRLDYGVAPGDWRAAQRNLGAQS